MPKTKAKSIEECAMLLEVEVSEQDITRAFEEVYDEITKVADVPGFRAGKAPKDIVKKHYVKNAREEVLKRLIPDAYRDALKEHKIIPLGVPEISDVRFDGDKELSFKAKVDLRPKFALKNYKGIKVEKKKASVKDEDVEKTLQSLREVNAKYISVDRPVQMEDYVVGDVECFADGKTVQKKRENIWLYIDKESIMSGLCENMVGMKKGEEKDIEVKLPDKYPDKNLAGKSVRYHVLAKEIKMRELPAVDDEFAKDMGKPNLSELKQEVAKELEARLKMEADVGAENSLLDRLMNENVFAVPSSFVNRQMDFMVENAKRRLQEKGFKKEDLDKKDAEFREKFKADAVKQVRLLFILDEIANREDIKVTPKDVEKAYSSIAMQAGKKPEEVKDYYEKEGLTGNLEEKLREGKTIEFLMKEADISEVEK